MNFNQYFPSDADYIFFARSLYGQLHLSSPITFAIHTITLGTLTAGMVKNNFEEAIKSFVASDNAFSFIRRVKGTPEYWKLFLYDVLAMKLGIPNIF